MANIKTLKKDIEKYLAGETIPAKQEGKFETETDYLKYLLGESLKAIESQEAELNKSIIKVDVTAHKRNMLIGYNDKVKEIAPKHGINGLQIRKLLAEANAWADYYYELSEKK